MTEITRQFYTGERALFHACGLSLSDCTFADGESPLKESTEIRLKSCMFKWKYPLWYSKHITVEDCSLFDTARAGIWYTEDIALKNTLIEAPKTFRRSRGIVLENVDMPNAHETLWACRDVKLNRVTAKGDYFAMNADGVQADSLILTGNYCFDGAKNVEISDSKLLSKDAFWNSENVTVKNSFISGEYLGWNARNLTLIDCTVESLQGLCYVENLVMRGCKLLNTTLAFEYSTVDVEAVGAIDSVKNPFGGSIAADEIGELISEENRVDVSATRIIQRRGAGKGKGND